MTLILSVLTKEAVYQISDRRLTLNQKGKAIEIISGEFNKAVIAEMRWAFGYTGLSVVGTESSDKWLARTILSIRSPDTYTMAKKIEQAASEEITKAHAQYLKKDRLFAFQAVGWHRNGPNSISPMVITVHNGWDLQRAKWRDDAPASFETNFSHNTITEQKPFDIVTVGQPLDRSEWREIHRRISRVARRPGMNGMAMTDTLVSLMRWLSGRRTTIGSGGMVVVIPAAGVANFFDTGNSPINMQGYWEGHISTFYYSDTGDPKIYAPHVVWNGTLIGSPTLKLGV